MPMTPPTIADAKKLAYDLRAAGVLVLALSGGKVGMSSYGMTRKQCDAMGKVLDQVMHLINVGTIAIPDDLL